MINARHAPLLFLLRLDCRPVGLLLLEGAAPPVHRVLSQITYYTQPSDS